MSTTLTVNRREDFKRSTLTSLRAEGNFPAVVYGYKVENTPIYIDSAEFTKTIREVGRNGVISLKVGGEMRNVVLTDYQIDPIKNYMVHADFLVVNMNEEIEADVKIELVGEAPGVKDGGVLQQPLHEVSITAKPDQIPESIKIEIDRLQVGESITIGDLKDHSTYEINLEDERVVASILAPRQEEEINSGEEQEAGHPQNEEGRETEPNGGNQ
ncbi:50S ribosomal protein L25/general stress protein Ctc [Bacillus sp. 2205SS5-2]|uniref:50S ribosomal protein L25/general stress protein Ctc n=1 Tax=Bacillus sp. 2205SS5-2 TaxID=3109031 RepID=UPI003005065B